MLEGVEQVVLLEHIDVLVHNRDAFVQVLEIHDGPDVFVEPLDGVFLDLLLAEGVHLHELVDLALQGGLFGGQHAEHFVHFFRRRQMVRDDDPVFDVVRSRVNDARSSAAATATATSLLFFGAIGSGRRWRGFAVVAKGMRGSGGRKRQGFVWGVVAKGMRGSGGRKRQGFVWGVVAKGMRRDRGRGDFQVVDEEIAQQRMLFQVVGALELDAAVRASVCYFIFIRR